MQKIKALWHKLKNDVGLIRYLIMGILTTLVNYLVYALVTRVILTPAHWFTGQVIAWLVAVVFSYFGNKLYVFQSKTHGAKDLLREAGSFVGMRLISWGFDALIMWVMVDLLHINDLIAKMVSQVVVIISNYVFSKFFIFTGTKKKNEENAPQEPAPAPSVEAETPSSYEKEEA